MVVAPEFALLFLLLFHIWALMNLILRALKFFKSLEESQESKKFKNIFVKKLETI
jgi:hypothetical protein